MKKEKKKIIKTCGECQWCKKRDDGHYRCIEGDYHFRVAKHSASCDYFEKLELSAQNN